jgi:hypothetical protein
VAAIAFVLTLALSALGLAQDDPPAVSLAPDQGLYLVKPNVPVIPVREREVWFRDSWSVRINAGYGTDSSLGEIVGGDFDVDSDNASLIGVDIGRPFVDDWRDWPIDFAWRLGAQLHGAGEDGGQSAFVQTAYLKMYWRPFPWERVVSTRIGFGEGLSYAWRVPAVEVEYDERHDDGTSRLLNYLDVSVDLNVGDLIRNERARACTLGLVISHRSGVFGLVDIFGGVHNGSNYNTAAVECGF